MTEGRCICYDAALKCCNAGRAIETMIDTTNLVTYVIEKAGGCVRPRLMKSHDREVPDTSLSGGRPGWPAILSSLKSLLETGKPLAIKTPPPQELLDAVTAWNS